ncbi:MAG: RNA-binding domain-containing protein [Acidilobaceae archaeon]
MSIASLDARVHVHATENKDKVIKALLEVFPSEFRDSISIRSEIYEGHHGNPIEILIASLRDPEATLKTLNYILSKLSSLDKSRLDSTLEDRVDKSGGLYIRVNKQEAYYGNLILDDSDDVVRIHIGFSGKRRDAIKFYREVLRGLNS